MECARTALFVLCGALCATAQTPLAKPLALAQSRYELRLGEPAEIQVPPDTLEFLLHAKTRKVTVEGQEDSGLVVAPNAAQDRILLGGSARAKPGEYSVSLSATSESGEQRLTTLNLVVQPRAGIPKGSTRPPVVLVNGWIYGFTGSCTVATTSATAFGNLASYLVNDGVPAVYLFDNCLEGPNATIETLANTLGDYLNTIKYDDGTQVSQIDLVAHSMGGLVARAYLSGLQPDQTYTPPVTHLVRKLVLIATPNFGSFVAGNYYTSILSGSQSAEMEPGSAFLWNLNTWNQHVDDLRGVDAIAVAGNAGVYVPSLSSSTALTSASDGLVSLTSASLGFVAQQASATRVVPYCHVDPSAFTNTIFGTFNCNAIGIANVTSTAHLTGRIVRSFLAGNTDWSAIGTPANSDAYLATNGGMFFAVQSTTATYVSDLTAVKWGTLQLTPGTDSNAIYYADYVKGTGAYTATSTSLGTITCLAVTAAVGYSAATRCKLGPTIFTVTPLSTVAAGRALTQGTTITLNDGNGGTFGSQCSGCKVTITPAGSTTSQTLTVTSWTSLAVSAKLPSSFTGFGTIKIVTTGGADTIGVMVAASSTISVTPLNVQFSYSAGGPVPAAQPIAITNTGTGTLAWTATASDSWLSLSDTSGTAPSTLNVSISPAGLNAGTYTGTVQIASAGASNSPVSVAFTLTIAAVPASLVVSQKALSYQYTYGGSVPAAQEISITNGGTGTLSWTASSGDWRATPSATSGDTPGTLSIAVDPANLAPGTYVTAVTVAATDTSVASVSIAVTLVVQGAQPAPTITAVVNAGSFQPGIASAAWVSIFGTHLSESTYQWQGVDIVSGVLPVSLHGVTVTINGLPAYIDYISPTQINVLVPDDATVGEVQVQVTTAQQASNSVTAQKAQFAPAFLTIGGTDVAALHLDYTLVVTAKPGEIIQLYGVGFGPSDPAQPTNKQVTAAAALANEVQIKIGGATAAVQYAGLVQSGLYQFNVTVPAALPNGAAALSATIAGITTQTGVTLTIQQ